MKRKRLNRDQWGFQYYPYYQMRIDDPLFHGLACLIRMTDGDANCWEMPKAGRVQVTGAGMSWLELIPDGQNRVITMACFPKGTHDPARTRYPSPADPVHQPSFWYVDVVDGIEYDDCGVAVFVDKYLDVIFTPEGDIQIDDRDELKAAFTSGELTQEQYSGALSECDSILKDLCADIPKTDLLCAKLMGIVEDRIMQGEPIHRSREVMEWVNRWEIRPVREDEFAACAGTIRQSFRTVADEFGFTAENAPRFTAFAMSEERIRREAENENRIVIGCFGREGQLVGCYSLYLGNADACELNHLCVLPECRHRHIGQMLVQDAIERAFRQGFRRMNISIVEENAVLKRWYESFGFMPVETKKFDFFPFTCGYMQRIL